MRKLLCTMLGTFALLLSLCPPARAGEALLIRHEVLTVPVGEWVEMTPGFFIGHAWTADTTVGTTGVDHTLRTVRFHAAEPGRTVIAAWSQINPGHRIEYEIVVERALDEVSTDTARVDAGTDSGRDYDDERGIRTPGPF
jgi:hypothetical protein